MRTSAQLLAFALLALGAARVRAQPMVSEPVEVGGAIFSPGVQAGNFEGQFGMPPELRARFDNGISVGRRDMAPAPDERGMGANAPGGSLGSEAGGSDAGLAAESGDLGAILENTGHAGAKLSRNRYYDAPGPIPPLPGREPLSPPRGLLDRFSNGRAEVPGTQLAQLPSLLPGPSLLNNLRQPALFAPKDVGNLSPESAMKVGNADYGLRVLGDAVKGEVPVPGAYAANTTPVTPPLPLLIEVKQPPPDTWPPPRPDTKPAAKAKQDGMSALAAAGFVIDNSFPVLPSSPGRGTLFVRGWAGSESLVALAMIPNVARVTVLGSPNAHSSRLTEIPVTLRVRMRAQESMPDFVKRAVPALEKQAGFRWRAAKGYQILPSPQGDVIVLSGEVPANSASRILSFSDLLRMEPYGLPPELPPAAGAGPSHYARFLRQLLDAVCLALAFPWLGIMFREIFFWLKVFVL